MTVYSINSNKLKPIQEVKFELERDLQRLTEENLSTLFGLELVCSEFPLYGSRIDSLAFDKENSSFVIIEYKRDRNFTVIDQGYHYLSLMLNNKAEFVLEYNTKFGKNLTKDGIDWTQSKVIFIADSYTSYQYGAIKFKDIPIELWETKRFENGTVSYNQIKSLDSQASIKTVGRSKDIEKVTENVKKYTEDDILIGKGKGGELYRLLKENILILSPEIISSATKTYIKFQIPGNWRSIFTVFVQKDKVIIEFLRSKPEDFKDPLNKVRYKKESFEYYNQHISMMDIKNSEDIDYCVLLIQQLYKRFTNQSL